MRALRAFLLAALTGAAAARAGAELVPTRYELDLAVDFREERVDGSARIAIENAGAVPASEASFLLYRLLAVSAVRDGAGEPLAFSQNVVAFEDDPKRQANQVRVLLAPSLAAGEKRTLEIRYGGYLAGYVETGALYIQDRVAEDFTILREDADAYPTLRPPSHAKARAAPQASFDYVARVTVPASHVVANGGRLVQRRVAGGRATYVYENTLPAWRMDFAIARFETLERPGLRVYALPGDAAGAERVAGAAQAALALFTEWFGPVPNRPSYAVIEVPDGWGSQADVTSILQSAAAFRDPGKLDEVYHEVSHLWNVAALDRPACRWEEGLASFLGALLQERLDGGPPLDERAAKTLENLRQRLAEDPELRRVPMVDYGKAEMTNASYRTGLLLFYLLDRVAGPETFRAVLREYHDAYAASGATAADLARLFEKRAGPSVESVFRDWLFTTRWTGIADSGASPAGIAARYRQAPAR